MLTHMLRGGNAKLSAAQILIIGREFYSSDCACLEKRICLFTAFVYLWNFPILYAAAK